MAGHGFADGEAVLLVLSVGGRLLETFVAGLATGATYSLLALGIVLVYKATKITNFAQGEFGTFAAYILWELSERRSVPWGVAAVIAIVAMAGLGLLVERFIARPLYEESKTRLVMASIALMSLFGALELKIWGPTVRQVPPPISGRGVFVGQYRLSPAGMLAPAAAVLIAVMLYAVLKHTTFGLGVLAFGQDPLGVRLMGVRVGRISAFTWASAGGVGALAGILVAASTGIVYPLSVSTLLLPALAAALLGGIGSLPGAVAGGLVIGVLEAFVDRGVNSVFVRPPDGLSSLVVFAVILGMLVARPSGLLGRAS